MMHEQKRTEVHMKIFIKPTILTYVALGITHLNQLKEAMID